MGFKLVEVEAREKPAGALLFCISAKVLMIYMGPSPCTPSLCRKKKDIPRWEQKCCHPYDLQSIHRAALPQLLLQSVLVLAARSIDGSKQRFHNLINSLCPAFDVVRVKLSLLH
jgi:hypothetical protein